MTYRLGRGSGGSGGSLGRLSGLSGLGSLGSLLLGGGGGSRGPGLAVEVESVEVSSDIHGVSLSSKIFLDHSTFGSSDINGDLISLDSGDDLVGVDEVSGVCSG